MASRKNEWKITKISNSARKNIEALDSNSKKALIENFGALQNNPFQKNIKKVEGKKDIYRGRIGDVRYYYRLLNKPKEIEILLVRSRGRIKKRTIQRLI